MKITAKINVQTDYGPNHSFLRWTFSAVVLNRQLPSTYYEVVNERMNKNTLTFAAMACTGSSLPFTLMKTTIRESTKARFCKTT